MSRRRDEGRRGNGEGSIHPWRDRWRGYLSVELGKREWVYGRSAEEVRKKLADVRRAHNRGELVTGRRQTLRAYLDTWLRDSVQPNVRHWTYKGYEVLVRVHIVPELGNVALDKLTPQHVQALMNKKLQSGLSPKTVQYMRGVLRTALGQALRWGMVSRNVAALVDGPRQQRKAISPLGLDEARVLLDAAREDRLGALYSVALAMGLRQGEALGLRWEDVELERRTLSVRYQLQRLNGKAQLVEPKTALSRRTLALPDSIATALEAHRARQGQEREWAGSRWVETGLVFTTPIGTTLDGPNVTKRFQRLLARVGLPKRRFHDLRHSCATLLLAQNVAPRVVMEILGHSQISLTMNTYTHVLPHLRREAAVRMDALLSDQKGGTPFLGGPERPIAGGGSEFKKVAPE